MAIDLSRYQRKKDNVKRGGGTFWRPESGVRYYVRVLPFEHTVNNVDLALGRYDEKDNLQVGDVTEELDALQFTHFLNK